MTGWSVLGIANQFRFWSPLLQETVPTATPTWVALLPNCCVEDRSPTMTSGPGTEFGTSGAPPRRAAGRVTDCGSPLTTVVISIGYIVVTIEILPTMLQASAGRPRLFANSSDIATFPPLIV